MFCRALHFFGSTSTITRFGERFRQFRDGQYSLVGFLFAVFLLTVPPCPANCKSGDTCPPSPMESAPVYTNLISPKSAAQQATARFRRYERVKQ